MKPEYLSIKKTPFLVRDSLELAQRIDEANADRIVDLRLTKPMMPEKRPIISSGLALGLNMSQMKWSCPCLGSCQYEPKHPRRVSHRISTCHDPVNYKNCEAIKY